MGEDDYQRKFDAAMAELDKAGVWRSNANPPYVRQARRLGFKPRPPYYVSAVNLAVWAGLYFGLFMGLYGYLKPVLGLRDTAMSGFAIALGAIMSGLLFGVSMAAWYRHVRKKHGLSSWEAL